MTNLTPIGNEADILRESQRPPRAAIPVRDVTPVPVRNTPNPTPVSPTPPSPVQPNVDNSLNSQASLDDYSETSLKSNPTPVPENTRQAPVQSPKLVDPRLSLPQPIKKAEYKPFYYRLPVINYVLSTIFFIASAITLLYYIQLAYGSLGANPSDVSNSFSSIKILDIGNATISLDLINTAGYVVAFAGLALAVTLLFTSRFILYISVFASLFGTAYWGYTLSLVITKTALSSVMEGVGIYIILIHLFMFSLMLTTFIHTTKSSIRT